MASKVLVGISQPGFYQQGKRRDEIVNLGYVGSSSTNVEQRVRQLEQNLRYLQEQHQIMLSGLHREVEVLRRRNRDLQFQMVFVKSGITVQSDETPSTSPEEDNTRKLTISPGQVNVTPLQIELLERDLAELKTNLGEARTRNLYLQSVVDDQKKTIQTLENERTEMSAVGKKISPVEKSAPVHKEEEAGTVESLRDKLDESDRMVRRLRRENEEQRKEIMSLRSAVGRVMSERRDVGSYHQDRHSYPRDQFSRFPPLFPSHWNQSKNNSEFNGRDRGYNHPRGEKQSNMTLPSVNDRNSGQSSSGSNSHQSNYRRGNSQRGHRSHRNFNRDQERQD